MRLAALHEDADQDDPACLYEGDSIDRLHEVVTEHFAPHRLTVMKQQQPRARFHRLHDGLVTLYELSYGADVRVHPGELPDFYNVQLPLAGGGTVHIDDAPLNSTLSIASPGDRLSMRWDSDARNRVLIIPAHTIEQAIMARLGDLPSGRLRFTHLLDERNPAVQSWVGLMWCFNAFTRSPLGHRSVLGTRHFERLLIESLLDAQPHSWVDALTGQSGTALKPRALRRATDFCHEHAHEPISVVDIAGAAQVSVRTLREGFRRHLNTSPLAYLRSVRLNRAHDDLTAIGRGDATGTVTDIAGRWGFTHLGRFSSDYKRAHGQLPSQTLRGQ